MKSLNKIIFSLIIFFLTILPSFAFLDAKVSKTHIYDTQATLMSEIFVETTLKTEKYWNKNLLYFNKYRPLFMLSNKELYNLMPKEKTTVMERVTAPSVYNISLKNSSIKTVSLSDLRSDKPTEQFAPVMSSNKSSNELISKYELAKNPDAESEFKIDTAILLKKSGKRAYYVMAMDLLNDVIKKEPYNAYAFFLKGELYAQQNSPESAMKNYIEALKLNPTSKQSYIGVAKLLESTNKELAKKYYEKADL